MSSRITNVHTVFESRAFHVDNNGMLAPFANMVNHDTLGISGANVRVRL